MDLSDDWKVYTPQLFREILTNKECSVLAIPLRIMSGILVELADYAIRKDDPELNVLMLRLSLFDVPPRKIQEAIDAERKRMAAQRKGKNGRSNRKNGTKNSDLDNRHA